VLRGNFIPVNACIKIKKYFIIKSSSLETGKRTKHKAINRKEIIKIM
jgi:hypothetical protein